MSRICEKCGRIFFEDDSPVTPMEELGRIFLGAVQDQDAGNLCPECRRNLGILSLLGFGE